MQVSDGALSRSDSFVLTVTAVNDRPTISNVPDQTVAEGGTTGAIAFTVGDAETSPTSLVVTRSSSNLTLLPNTSIVLAGSGANRTVTITPVPGKTGTAVVTLSVSDGSATASDTFTVQVQSGLLLPWVDVGVGAPTPTGDASYAAGKFTVSGGGEGVGGYADQFHFVYLTMTGDGSIVARLAGMDSPTNEAQAGVMVRSDLTSGSANFFVGITPSRCFWQRRLRTGAATSVSLFDLLNPAPDNWVRITRTGDTFATYVSKDAVTWSLLGSVRLPFPQSLYIGLAVSSRSGTSLNTVSFDHVTVVP